MPIRKMLLSVGGRGVKRALAIGIAVIGFQLGHADRSTALADAAKPDATGASATKIAATTRAYVETFYPLWIANHQFSLSAKNRMVGPIGVTPAYRSIVSINVDTIYAGTVMDLAEASIVLTFPPTQVTYSILTVDAFGNVFDTGIEAEAGTYVLTGPDFDGHVPHGITEIEFPVNASLFIIRADKYTSSNVDNRKQARLFRKRITTQTLAQYHNGDAPEKTRILPSAVYAPPFKAAADALIKVVPFQFLRQLQEAVKSEWTPPLSKAEQKVSDKFDTIFNNGNVTLAEKVIMATVMRETKARIQSNYYDAAASTNWIHFSNIGDWGDAVLDRASVAEFIQYANSIETSAYYHAFSDKKGKALDGSNKSVYVLKFSKKTVPDVNRFWSLTAYTPETQILIRNAQKKYAVASYTPGLKYEADGGLKIYISAKKPAGVPKANWLPVSGKRFNVLLRLYGPEGDVGDYEPPAIRKR